MTDQYNDDLDQWRAAILAKKTLSKEYAEGFQIMDMDNGALWDLTKQLMAHDPRKRLSAAAALTHESFGRGIFGKVNVILSRAQGVVDQVTLDVTFLLQTHPAKMRLLPGAVGYVCLSPLLLRLRLLTVAHLFSVVLTSTSISLESGCHRSEQAIQYLDC